MAALSPRTLALLLAISIAGTSLAGLGAAPARAQGYTLGVDVSHWQEEDGHTINWQKVAETHVFAFHKATEGATYSDPRYAGNRTDAASVSIPFGAYHFARPSGGTIAAAQADAATEAQYFLNVAQPAPGDLIPVLDLEASGGLPVRRLKTWVQSWLDTIIEGLGVKPLIYTSPNFWGTYMNDTTTFAEQGFPLWIAHYTPDSTPRTPANNWNGEGWAFWQWTSQAKVPGIYGNADEDRFAGSDLAPYKIPGAPLPEPTPDPATPPVNQSPPEISGDTEVGSTLTASSGTWAGSQPQSYSYGWYRCDTQGASCSGIFEATGPRHELVPADFGYRLKVTVTATNSAASTQQDSSPTEVITDTVPPKASQTTAPTNGTTLAATMRAAWISGEPGVSTYDVRYRATSQSSTFGDYSTLLSDTPQTDTTMEVVPGSTYCFSSRAVDEAGNRSIWSSERCSAVPLDDRDLTASKEWNRRSGSAFYLGTVTTSTLIGEKLTAPDVRVRDIYLVVQRCPTCGKVAVSFNGRRIATIDLRSATTARRIIRVAGFSGPRTGTIQVQILSRHRAVKIDGLVLGIRA